MDSSDIIGLIAVIAIFLIPSIGLTARFALKPIVESVLRLRDALDLDRHRVAEDPRIATLQQQVMELNERVDRLSAAVEFDNQLRGGEPTAARLPGASD